MRLSVNGETVEPKDLWRGHYGELAREAKTSTADGYEGFVFRRAVELIRDRIAEMLLYQQAKLRIADDAMQRADGIVDAEIRRTISTAYDGRQARYEKQLAAEGRTLEEVREQIRRELIITSYLESEIKPRVAEPTRDELWAAYQASADTLRREARRRMSLIDIRVRSRLPAGVQTPTPEQWETARTEARSRAESALTELRNGTPFAEVAARYSDGLHAADGGSWGWITPGSVRRRFEPAVAAAYGLPAGQFSDIIDVKEDLFIVRCDDIEPGYEPEFQSEQPRLRDQIIRSTYNRLIMELVEDLRAKARIEPADLEDLHAAVVAAAPKRELFSGTEPTGMP